MSELTYGETQAAKAIADEEKASMSNSDSDIAYFNMPIRISEYALDALKAEMSRRKMGSLSEVLEAIAADLEAQRGKGNPNVRRYR